MHDVIQFLRDAVDRGPAPQGLGDTYIIDGKMIRAYNGILEAGIAWPSKKSFALPAKAVDDFLARAPDVKKMKVEENAVTLQSGRLSSRIERRFEEALPIPDMPTEWRVLPEAFTSALKVTAKFTGDPNSGSVRQWMTCVRLFEDRLTAGSGSILIDVVVPGLEVPEPILLSKNTVDFLVAQGNPKRFWTTPLYAAFEWEDGRWMRSRLVDDTMDEGTVQRIFNELTGSVAPVKFDAGWTAALKDALALVDSENIVNVIPDGLIVSSKHITSTIELSTNVPIDHSSNWKAKDLLNVVGIATSWNPDAYPHKPALFLGEGEWGGKVRGAISGHR
jgi:hypothetical protein